jgi:23S rRNA (cytosine1962-C5)-methyltransferase
MRLSTGWRGGAYELIDASAGERLERWGEYLLIRPDPQIIWQNESPSALWGQAHARYIRSSKGGGSWDFARKMPEQWQLGYKNLRFKVKPTGFKHTGIFPEQAANWDWCESRITAESRAEKIKILNLFAYTGGATIACAKAGAAVCHVDAVKSIVDWAKENAAISGVTGCRFITDDAVKFLGREIRRGSRYDAVILDPPSFGHGTGGELWKLEDKLFDLLKMVKACLSDRPLFVMLNGYTSGIGAGALLYLLKMVFGAQANITAEEIGLPVTQTGLALPCGYTAIVQFS